MLISQIIEKLEILKAQFQKAVEPFLIIENSGGYVVYPLSDNWYDVLHDKTSFYYEGDYYSFLNFIPGFVNSFEQTKAEEALKDPEIGKKYECDFEEYISDCITQEEALVRINAGKNIISEVKSISEEYQLEKINFDINVFLGLDEIYYESSRC